MTERQRLAVVIPSLGAGGAERAVSLLAAEWAKTRRVRLFLLENRQKYPLAAGVEVEALGPALSGKAAHLARIPFHARALRKSLAAFRPDAVVAHMEQANILALWAAPPGVPVVVTQHIAPNWQYAGKGLLGQAIMAAARRQYPKARRVACVSEGVARATQEVYRLPPGKAVAVYNPIDRDSLLRERQTPPPSDDLPPGPFFLAASRIVWRHKGQDLLLRAFQRVAQDYPDIFLVIAGDGPDRAKTEALARELGLTDRVRFVGWQKQIGSWLGQALAFVAASRYEGMPMTLLEAMACECPVVTTDCESGPAEVLENGNCGWLAPVEDVVAIAEGMKQLLVDADLRERYRAAGLERVKAFTPARVAERYLILLSHP